MFGKKRSLVMMTTIVILVISIFYFFFSPKQIYGNDEQSIEQVIKSIEGYESESIEILEIKDIKNDRIVGFLSNNHPAYIQFSKNQKGNYEWKHIEKRGGLSFATFLIDFQGSSELKFMIVTTQENRIAKMQVGVNGHIMEQKFRVNQKSVAWIDLPEPNGGSYTFTYKYFDKDGKQIPEAK